MRKWTLENMDTTREVRQRVRRRCNRQQEMIMRITRMWMREQFVDLWQMLCSILHSTQSSYCARKFYQTIFSLLSSSLLTSSTAVCLVTMPFPFSIIIPPPTPPIRFLFFPTNMLHIFGFICERARQQPSSTFRTACLLILHILWVVLPSTVANIYRK